jgi:hypothetical protein
MTAKTYPVIDRGAPITELVRGSLEYTLTTIRRAFDNQFDGGYVDGSWLWVEDTFEDYVIVSSSGLAPSVFYQVAYLRGEDDDFAFADVSEWEIVQLAYEMADSDRPAERGGVEESEEAEKSEEEERPEEPEASEKLEEPEEAEESEKLDELEELEAEDPEESKAEDSEESEKSDDPEAEDPELAHNSYEVSESRRALTRRDAKTRFIEVEPEGIQLMEANGNRPRIIHATVATADMVNGNGRRYPLAVLKEAVELARDHLRESMGQGRARLLGEAEHPSDKGKRPMFLETVTVWTDIWFEEETGQVKAKGRMVENTVGKDAIATMEAGVLPGVSLRGYGESHMVKEDGSNIEEVDWINFTGIDLVLDPSFQDAAVDLFESEDPNTPMEEAEMTANTNPPAEAPALTEEQEVREQLQAEQVREQEIADARAMAESARKQESQLRQLLGLDETADVMAALEARNQRLAEMEEAQRLAEVADFVGTAVADVEYPEGIMAKFREYIGQPDSLEEAETRIAEARELFDGIVAELRLQQKGMKPKASGVQVLGPVIETDAGAPAYAKAAYEITESLVKAEKAERRNLAEPKNRSEIFTVQYLKRFDEEYRSHLLAESKLMEEAELSTDLNLPYSVLRAVVEEAFPQLVAAGIFDIGTINQAPIRVHYEAAYANESGATGSATDESVTSDEGAWVALANKRIDFGSVVVTSDPAGTTYVEGTDYAIDYAEGKLYTITTANGGSIGDSTALLVDYTYYNIRKGESAEIERAKTTLSYQTLEVAADRLATEITSEAVVFSRSQLGWDATTRTIGMLIKEVMRRIDSDLFHAGLGAALQVASNSGGTWAKGVDTYDTLRKYIGYAKVKVANRFYEPTFVLMSVTNADELSNADFFSQSGAIPGYDLNAAGYVGRVKSLPVFASTEFPDGYALVGNRELVMHRVFQPMQLQGPFQTFGANRKLVASKQYFIEEYNGHIEPVPGKGAYVKIA